MTDKFGGGHVKFGVLGDSGRRVARTRNFGLTPGAFRTVEGKSMPTRLDVHVNAGGYRVVGTITEQRFQDAVDVLASVSLPVRLAIKAFHTEPYLLRWVGRYELDVTDKDGVTVHISGECPVEVDTY